MKFKARTLRQLAEMICGDGDQDQVNFPYRSSRYITEFFQDCDTDFVHDGSTRPLWVADVLAQILSSPHPNQQTPPAAFARVIERLMDKTEERNETGPDRPDAMRMLSAALAREGFEPFYGEDNLCHLRHIATNTIAEHVSPHRPLSAAENARRDLLQAYLEKASEDDLIGEVLFPMFRQMGFHRVTVAGHRDKALEYGKDVWMKYTLPTQHVLYFGIQAKKGKLDAAGMSRDGNANVAEILNQITMMLGHEIFDPETSRRVLVDHAFIVAGGEITKAARNWIGNKLDATKRSQIMFMDRDDILNLYVVTGLPLPEKAMPPRPTPSSPFDDLDDDIPF